MIWLFSGTHSLFLQHAYFPLSVSLNFQSTSVYKKSAVKVLFHFPWTILSSCSWSSVYGSQVARGLCLWVSIYTRFLEEGSDVHLWAQFLSPFHWFFSFLVVTLGSSIPRHQCPIGTPSASTFWIHFQFHLFFTFLSMATESWQTQCVFSNCSGLLRCLKQGSRQFTTIFTRLASENMDLQVVRCMDQTRLRNEIKTIFLTFFF